MLTRFIFLIVLQFLHDLQACPYIEKQKQRRLHEGHDHNTTDPTAPSEVPPHFSPGYIYGGSFAPYCKKTNGADASPTSAGVYSAYSEVSASFLEAIPSDPKGAALLFAKAMRLTWHDSGEFDQTSSDTLGPDGCLSYTSLNAGLIESTSITMLVFEPMWQNVCDRITRADFWAMLGKIVFEHSQFATEGNFTTVVTPFAYGRQDSKECSGGAGRLPSPQNASSEIKRVFIDQMGLSRADSVTLIGAHTLGYVHSENSGYGIAPDPTFDPTTNAFDVTPHIFDNSYFQFLIGVGWDNVLVGNDPTKNQWLFQADPLNSGNQLIVLNTDMINAFPIDMSGPYNTGVTYTEFPDAGQSCFPYPNDEEFILVLDGPQFDPLCSANRLNQTLYSKDDTPTYAQVLRYINRTTGNAAFLADFAVSYAKMINVGYGINGKLGQLTPIELSNSNNASVSATTTSKKSHSNDLLIVSIVVPIVAFFLLAGLFFFLFNHYQRRRQYTDSKSEFVAASPNAVAA